MITTGFGNIIDIISLSVLMTFSVYHFIIYRRRKKYSEEGYNLYFSLFSFFVAIYLLLESPMFVLAIVTHGIYGDWVPVVQGAAVLGVFFSFTNFFSMLVDFPAERMNYLRYGLYYLAAILSVTLSSMVKGWLWYDAHFNTFVIVATALYALYTSWVYGQWMIAHQIYRKRTPKILIAGICFLIFYLLAVKVARIFIYPQVISGINAAVIVVLYSFAYALAEKFNGEYEELILLKNTLEQRISERTAELANANHQIEAASRERSDFFINLAHETKTPLTIISNYLERYIERHGVNEEIKIIKRNIDKLCTDMVSFLDMEMLLQGSYHSDNDQRTSISDSLNEKIELFREYARGKSIRLDADIHDGLHVKADPYLIDRIINNLIENAIKYTPANGEIDIRLTDRSGQVVFTIRDTGIGIPQEKQSRIFEPYFQVSHKKSNTQGIGMGLATVKKSVELLSGSISVESTEHKGTLFTVVLPLHTSSIQEPGRPAAATPPSFQTVEVKKKSLERGKKNILLVEDNIDMLNYLMEELGAEYNVIPAVNGVEALDTIRRMPGPALIISDIMMDGMDGEEFYRRISLQPETKNIPFVFLTAKAQEDEKLKMLQSGAIDYIYKPFSSAELKAKVGSIIANAEKQKTDGLEKAVEIITRHIKDPEQAAPDRLIVFSERCAQYGLTERQQEIVSLVAEGYAYKQIADKLFISEKTIFRHVENIFTRLGVHNKVDMINVLYK